VSDWTRTLATIKPLVVAVYVPPFALLLALLTGTVALGRTDGGGDGWWLWALVVAAIAALPFSLAMGARLLRFDRGRAAAADRSAVLAAAAARLRTSALATAALGALVPACGLVHHLAGGARGRLVYFLALTGAHAALTLALAGRAAAALRGLAARR